MEDRLVHPVKLIDPSAAAIARMISLLIGVWIRDWDWNSEYEANWKSQRSTKYYYEYE